MKKVIATFAACVVSVAAFGQGAVIFNTHVTSGSDLVDARVITAAGTPAGLGYVGQLFIVGAGDSLTPMTPVAAFKTSATGIGYINAGSASAPVSPAFDDGKIVTIRFRAWKGDVNSSYASATEFGQSADLPNVKLGVSLNQPPNLVGLQGFTLVPEPTTLALGAIGFGALMIRRRK